MTQYPRNLTNYPNRDTMLPLHIGVNRLTAGFPSHRHDFLEFSFVIGGRGAEWINGVRHPMQPGTFTLILPYQIHEIRTEPGQTLELVNCMFGMDLLMGTGRKDELSRLLADDSGLAPYIQLDGEMYERLHTILIHMMEEYNGDDYWRASMLQAKLIEVLVAFDRGRRQANHRHTERTSTVKASPTWRIIHYIQRNHQDPLTLSQLSERFAMSMSRISERIKEVTGQTFMQLLSDLRIRHACSLLASTDMSVSEICYEVGFGSYKTFARLFRARERMAPTTYRKQILGNLSR